MLVIHLGLVEEVSNIIDLVLDVKFLESLSCKSAPQLEITFSFCFFCVGDDGREDFFGIV